MPTTRVDRSLTVIMRVLALLVAVVATAQAALAGRFLSGDFGALETHTAGASALGVLVIAAAVVAAIRFARSRRVTIDLLVAALLVVGVAVQAAVATINLLAVHIPLGVAVIALSFYNVAITLRPPRMRASVTADSGS